MSEKIKYTEVFKGDAEGVRVTLSLQDPADEGFNLGFALIEMGSQLIDQGRAALAKEHAGDNNE